MSYFYTHRDDRCTHIAFPTVEEERDQQNGTAACIICFCSRAYRGVGTGLKALFCCSSCRRLLLCSRPFGVCVPPALVPTSASLVGFVFGGPPKSKAAGSPTVLPKFVDVDLHSICKHLQLKTHTRMPTSLGTACRQSIHSDELNSVPPCPPPVSTIVHVA